MEEITAPISQEELLYLCKIVEIPFVKEALFQTVFKKLYIDGYVYCGTGLYPNNKEILKGHLRNSNSKYLILLDKNAASYSELLKSFSQIIEFSTEQITLSNTEAQSILYALMSPIAKANYSFILYLALKKLYPNSKGFVQYGLFIKSKNVELIEITSLEKFIAEISRMPTATNYFARGHSNINYLAVPSLFREKRLYQHEYMMYQELVIRCPESFIHCTSHLDFLVEMQHYGLPTRLLDVTLNPLIALYFACENSNAPGEVLIYEVQNKELKYEKCDEVAVLSSLPMLTFQKQKELLNVLGKNNIPKGPEYEEFISEVRAERPAFMGDVVWEKIVNPVFVKPTRRNQRIAHQEGAFLIWGLDPFLYSSNDQAMHIEQDYRYFSNDKKMVLFVNANKKDDIVEKLNRIGINKAYVYPEIDDVAEYIKSSIRET